MRFFLLMMTVLLLCAQPVYADCTSGSTLIQPHTRTSWIEGGLVYDTTNKILKTCDGTNWITVNATGGVWTTDGTDVWRATGRVGIGTAGPVAALEVVRTNSAQRWRYSATGTDPFMDLWSTNSATAPGPRISFLTNNAAFEVYDQDANASRLFITDTGNVGIGTASPTERVDLGGGNIKMGYERVENACTGTSCNSTSATCPTGKYVLGGGCVLDNTTRSLFRSYPTSDNQWGCHSQQNLENAGSIIRAYAICANIR